MNGDKLAKKQYGLTLSLAKRRKITNVAASENELSGGDEKPLMMLLRPVRYWLILSEQSIRYAYCFNDIDIIYQAPT